MVDIIISVILVFVYVPIVLAGLWCISGGNKQFKVPYFENVGFRDLIIKSFLFRVSIEILLCLLGLYLLSLSRYLGQSCTIVSFVIYILICAFIEFIALAVKIGSKFGT